MPTLLNACDGHQQTAQFMAGDILSEPLPIATGPRWGRIDAPGLGVEADEQKLASYHQAFLDHGDFPPYGAKLGKSD
jgi:L-Ala-D/L-Glu epimerase